MTDNHDATLGSETTSGDPAPFTLPADTQEAWSVDEVLAMARLPEGIARVCLRADLDAQHEALTERLAPLVSPDGTIIDNDTDRTIGDVSNADQAQALARELREVETERGKYIWTVKFRALDDETLHDFNAKHRPSEKASEAAWREYGNHLVAACAVEPTITVEQMRELRRRLSSRAITELTNTASAVSTKRGVDAPFSLVSSRILGRG